MQRGRFVTGDWLGLGASVCSRPQGALQRVAESLHTFPDGASFAQHQGGHCAQEFPSGRASDPPLPDFALALITESGFTTVSQLQATFSAPCPDLPNGPVAPRWRWLLTRRWYLLCPCLASEDLCLLTARSDVSVH